MARKATGRKAPARKAPSSKAPTRKAAASKTSASKAPAKKTARKAAPADARKKVAAAPVKAGRAVARKADPKAAARKAAPKSTARAGVPKSTARAGARQSAERKVTPKTASRKAAPKSATRKLASSQPAARKAAPKVAATRTTAAKTTASKAAPKRTPIPAKRSATVARLKTAAPVQSFTISHLNEADFKKDGLRPYALYRDLGVAAATGGLCQAHVIRMIPPCTDDVRKRHVHAVELQLVYVLKGWIKNEFEGHGEQMMSQGTCWIQPPNIKHTVLDYSADFEGLEIIIPADFATTEVA